MRTGHLEELAIVIFGGQINLAGASLDVLLHGREVDTTRSVVQRRCLFRCTTLRRRDSICATTRSVVQRSLGLVALPCLKEAQAVMTGIPECKWNRSDSFGKFYG